MRRAIAARDNASYQRAKRFERMMPWANRLSIRDFYVLAQKLTYETGIPHEVDHVIPLQGKKVSGLHVENNLRVVPMTVNRSKHNHYEL